MSPPHISQTPISDRSAASSQMDLPSTNNDKQADGGDGSYNEAQVLVIATGKSPH